MSRVSRALFSGSGSVSSHSVNLVSSLRSCVAGLAAAASLGGQRRWTGIGDGPKRSAQLSESGRYWWFDIIVVDLTSLDAEHPAEVQQPRVADRDLRSDLNHGSELATGPSSRRDRPGRPSGR